MSLTKRIDHLLDSLLAVPPWYAAILLAQLQAREIPPLLKPTLERSDKALCEWVRGHRLYEVPELVKGFQQSRWYLLESEVQNELVRRIDWFSSRALLRTHRFLSRYIADTLKLTWNAAKSSEPKEETADAKTTRPKAMGRPIARSPRPPRPKSPRSSAQQIGSHGGAQRVRPLNSKKKTTKQSQGCCGQPRNEIAGGPPATARTATVNVNVHADTGNGGLGACGIGRKRCTAMRNKA